MPASTSGKQFTSCQAKEDSVWQPHPQYSKAEAQEGDSSENARDNKIQNVRAVQFLFPIMETATYSGILYLSKFSTA